MPSIKFILGLPFSLRQRKLSFVRAPMERQAFIDAIASTELGSAAAALLWEKLSEIKVYRDFTPYPSDDLLEVFGLAEDDLDVDIIIDIAKTLNRTVPDQTTVDTIGAVATPADVVRLIEATDVAGADPATD